MSRAFTLFEVAISLALVAMGVTSVLLLFPTGLKTQQMARYRVYASAKALEMVDAYNTFPTANPSLESEAPNPWDVSTGRGNMAFDLERRLSSFRFGIMPVPLDIARRIDSEGDEIARVLGEGGRLYYSQPLATTGFMESGLPTAPPNEAQRLVFTVVGHAQSNAIAIFPWKAWPYYAPFPSPPAHGTHGREPGFSEPLGAIETVGGKRGILFEDSFDADMRPVFWCRRSDGAEYGYRHHQVAGTRDSAIRYCQAALWYCARKGLTPAFYDQATPITDFDPAATPPDMRWKQVQALRFLAHATTCLTTYVDHATLSAGLAIPPIDLIEDGTTPAPYTATHDRIVALHDSAKNLAMLFAASHPYDWAVPRPLERAIMMDHPLIEWDMFSDPLRGTIWKTSVSAAQWRPVPARPIENIGRSFQFSNLPIPSDDPAWEWGRSSLPSFWGDEAHFTLTNAFEPSERCRQLVFWAVDWMAYEDVETAPSAPVDACRYPRGAPRLNASFTALLTSPPFFDWQQYSYRNPEKVMLFKQDLSDPVANPTGSDVSTRILGLSGGPTTLGSNPRGDQEGQAADARAVFSGLYGADRNMNRRLDRGSLPRSTRVRAMPVARFNFYDLRVPAALR
ncbi:MAG TPA: hypothetical protein VEL07_10315 [Planctomycetota bacterium]|nr:hypothetical protein [Planctomycetota bacterium]